MKKIKWVIKSDLYWAKITKDYHNNEVAESANPNEEAAKLVILNKKRDKIYVLSEDRILPIAVHHYSGTSRNYYTDEPESYSYDDCAKLYFLSNFDANSKIEEITSYVSGSVLIFEDVLKLEKYQNAFIEIKAKEEANKKILYSINEKINKEKRNEEKAREIEAHTNYPEAIR